MVEGERVRDMACANRIASNEANDALRLLFHSPPTIPTNNPPTPGPSSLILYLPPSPLTNFALTEPPLHDACTCRRSPFSLHIEGSASTAVFAKIMITTWKYHRPISNVMSIYKEELQTLAGNFDFRRNKVSVQGVKGRT